MVSMRDRGRVVFFGHRGSPFRADSDGRRGPVMKQHPGFGGRVEARNESSEGTKKCAMSVPRQQK